MNKQAFSKIGILIILIVLIGGGILAWQYLYPEKEEKEKPKGEITEETGIKVSSPKYGDEWEIGETYNIKWDASIFGTEKISIALTDKNRASVGAVWDMDEVPNIGTYLFTVPAFSTYQTIIPGDKYQFCLATKAVSACSQVFSITPEDETADWKTYRNDSLGYNVKYPKTWGKIEQSIESEKTSNIFALIQTTEWYKEAYIKLARVSLPDVIGEKKIGEYSFRELAEGEGCVALNCAKVLSINPILSKNQKEGYLIESLFVARSGEEYKRYMAIFLQGIERNIRGLVPKAISIEFSSVDSDLMNKILEQVIILELLKTGERG